MTRQGATLGGSADVTSSLTLDAHLGVNNDVARNRPATGDDPSNTIGDLVRTGRQVDLPALKGHTGTIEVDSKQISWNYAGFNNPYFALQNNENRDDRTRWIGGGSATYTLTPSVRAIARAGTDHWNQSRDFDIAPT